MTTPDQSSRPERDPSRPESGFDDPSAPRPNRTRLEAPDPNIDRQCPPAWRELIDRAFTALAELGARIVTPTEPAPPNVAEALLEAAGTPAPSGLRMSTRARCRSCGYVNEIARSPVGEVFGCVCSNCVRSVQYEVIVPDPTKIKDGPKPRATGLSTEAVPSATGPKAPEAIGSETAYCQVCGGEKPARPQDRKGSLWATFCMGKCGQVTVHHIGRARKADLPTIREVIGGEPIPRPLMADSSYQEARRLAQLADARRNAAERHPGFEAEQQLELFRRGDLTAGEFDAFCHMKEGERPLDPKTFAKSCGAYQRKLFGCAPDEDARKGAESAMWSAFDKLDTLRIKIRNFAAAIRNQPFISDAMARKQFQDCGDILLEFANGTDGPDQGELAKMRAKVSERKTVHEWLNELGIPRQEAEKPLCLLRRLRILCDRAAALVTENRQLIHLDHAARNLIALKDQSVHDLRDRLNKTRDALLRLASQYRERAESAQSTTFEDDWNAVADDLLSAHDVATGPGTEQPGTGRGTLPTGATNTVDTAPPQGQNAP